ncbi:MAG: glycosyltransferase family 39 protein [Bryobacteraceae bacterium]
MQASTGAWNASFTSYPDEPAHFVGSVMVRDYLASLPAAPRRFAENYYWHYPYFGVGIWPPLLYLITALWFLIAGVGRVQALLVVAAATAGTASVICSLVRKRAGLVAGFCAGLLFLSLPEVQRWLCAVVADNVVTFFCLAAAACLIRYFEAASFRSALGFALCAGCAILTKYSAWFLCVLPFAALVALRRFDLLRKRSLWTQPIAIGATVGPWAIWTAKFITRVPAWPLGSVPGRLGAFSLEAVRILPPVLAVAAAVGLLLLALRPGIWKADLAVLVFFVLGQIAFLSIAPPAGVETRYVLPVAGAVLVLAFAGWQAALEPLTRRGGAWAQAVPAFCLALTLPFAATHLRAYSRPPRYPIRNVVETIMANRAWDGKRILVASDLEGPIIAEFAIQDRPRPGHWLLRPSKVLASSNWYGSEYSSFFHSAEDLGAWLKEGHLAVIIWHQRHGELRPHEVFLGQVLAAHPPWLREVASFDSSAWEIYEYVPATAAPR